MRPEILV